MKNILSKRMPYMLIFTLCSVAGCVGVYDEPRIPTDSQMIYKIDKGRLKKDRRMEKIKKQGCINNSVDCGNISG